MLSSSSDSKRDKAAAARRDKILEAAVICFLENGYHQTGVRDIAKQAGVSLGNLYNHFPGKHDVLVEIARLERAELDGFIRMLADPAPALEVFDRFLTAYATYLSAPENVILAIEITSEAIRKPDLGALFLENRDALTTALVALLARGIEAGTLRPNAPPEETAHMVLELVEARAYHSVLEKQKMARMLPGLRGGLHALLGAQVP